LSISKPMDGSEPLSPGLVLAGWTEKCSLALGTSTNRVVFKVLRVSDDRKPDFDGAVGWVTLKRNTIVIDAVKGEMTTIKRVPKEAKTWTRFHITTNPRVLALNMPARDGHKFMVVLDTGSYLGVGLSPVRWREWKAIHTNQSLTLTGYSTLYTGLIVREEAWADKLSIGPMDLTDVPVIEFDSAFMGAGGAAAFDASLGMAALRRMDVIIDGRHRLVYVRPKSTPAPPYEHDRAGACFLPNSVQGDSCVASVIEGSPAWIAGIRNGDVLLKIGDMDVSQNESNEASSVNGRFREPAGTKIDLTLKRGDSVFETTVELKDILGPSSKDGLK
jgi:hypothetical protein